MTQTGHCPCHQVTSRVVTITPRGNRWCRQALVVQPTPENEEETIMKKAQQLVARFVREESGQDLIEYALIAALIALAAIGAMQTLGNDIGNTFNSVSSSL
jgi:pilus assembly protein Flp/PilA